jgi:hypothetical protein
MSEHRIRTADAHFLVIRDDKSTTQLTTDTSVGSGTCTSGTEIGCMPRPHPACRDVKFSTKRSLNQEKIRVA